MNICRNFSKKGGTRPPSPLEVNSRGSSPAVGRFAPSGLPSLSPRLIEMIRLVDSSADGFPKKVFVTMMAITQR